MRIIKNHKESLRIAKSRLWGPAGPLGPLGPVGFEPETMSAGRPGALSVTSRATSRESGAIEMSVWTPGRPSPFRAHCHVIATPWPWK